MVNEVSSSGAQAEVLIQALPYIRRYRGRTVVVKFGGAAMVEEWLRTEVMRDILLLYLVGIRPVLVHGGGPEISEMMKRLGKTPQFVDGQRVTDAETMEIVEMVLSGKTNKGLVSELQRLGAQAVGLSGKDGGLLVARRRDDGTDLGLVGDIVRVNTDLLDNLAEAGYIPVICSVAVGDDGSTYNVNADLAAGAIAAAVHAEKLILLTDVSGVLGNREDASSLLSVLDEANAEQMIASGRIDSGMLPKVRACLAAVDGGVARAHIIDGRQPHALLVELFTDAGVGTMIQAG